MSFGRRIPAALALCFVLGACRSAPPPNVVIVLVDTLRADYLGSYGHPARLTPFLDELAGRGIRYAHAYAASTWTSPSVASLFTSRWQSQHGVVNIFSVLPDGEHTLAEALRARGYATAAFLATRSLPAASGFGQGFDVWEQTMEEKQLKGSGAQLNQRVFAWLDARPRGDRQPVLLYLHYMEPHFPYEPQPDRLDAVLAQHGFTAEQRRAWDTQVDAWLEHAMGEGVPRREDMDVVRDQYLAEVASFDLVMRELVLGLTARGVLPNAVLVLTADHGEEFYEHGNVGHGVNLFNETLRVPLLLVAPGVAPAVVDEVVSLLDVAPAALALVGAPAEPRFEGRGLVRPPAGGAAYAELAATAVGKGPEQNRTLVDGARKLTLTPAGGEEFYDLAHDPGERNPQAFDEAGRAALRQALDTVRAQARRDAGAAQQRELDEATRERLRALGYVK